MGSSTHGLDGSPFALREGTREQAEAELIRVARHLEPKEKIETATDALGVLGFEQWNDNSGRLYFSLADDRVPYWSKADCEGLNLPHLLDEFGADGIVIAAHAVAPFVVRGCWDAWETDGESCGIVWDGERAHCCRLIPHPPEGMTVADLVGVRE